MGGAGVAVAAGAASLRIGARRPHPVVSVPLVPPALGCALTVPPPTAATTVAVPAERAALAAGVLDSARQMAGGPGIAVFGAPLGDGFEAGVRLSPAVGAARLTVTFALSFRLAGRSARRP
ncbi:hypothetical protein AB0C13_07425 [Streptomyces sp. NPDC049099]|uniref:hypothetical protein n=1 Tax=Streptomyces sp. NPDC049099 TaxID=3155768 RepID=UPI003422EA2F